MKRLGSVAHLVPALFGRTGVVGGAERYAFELALAMAESVPTTLVTFGDADEMVGPVRGLTLGAPWYVRARSNSVNLRLLSALRAAVPPGVPLTIVAPRPDPPVYRELSALAAGRSVRFAFDLPDAELVREDRRASSVVLPSVHRSAAGETKGPELLGQKLLEGMACEAPAVCTRVASLPELVHDGETGFVVPPNDPKALGERLEWLHLQRAEGADLGRAGRRRVQSRFTWPLVVDRCLEAFRGVAAVPSLPVPVSS